LSQETANNNHLITTEEMLDSEIIFDCSTPEQPFVVKGKLRDMVYSDNIGLRFLLLNTR
jgi:hypothetical protein